MRPDLFLRLGLLLILAVLAAPAVNHVFALANGESLNSLQGTAIQIAGACLGIALVLSLVEKIGFRVAMGRCQVCRRSVQHGHTYCHDHLRDLQYKGQERIHRSGGVKV